jgi:coniferyl-aldehyde dehydrogenase
VPARYARYRFARLHRDRRARFRRVTAALDDAEPARRHAGATGAGQRWDEATRKIAPHLVLNAPDDCELLTREIFGPVLPVRGYRSLEEVIGACERAAAAAGALPVQQRRGDACNCCWIACMSGGVRSTTRCSTSAQHDLPFGGVGASGMGHYHGHEGFLTFSKLRPVFRQARWSSLAPLMPPYGKLADRILRFLTR